MTQEQISQLQQVLEQEQGPTSCVSTHVSWVLLCPTVVYKIPKAVRLPYLDFSTLEHRQLYCDNEVKLNNRLTEGVYLEVVPVWSARTQLGIENLPAGATVLDYAVKMKRLPQDRLMWKMLQRQQVAPHHIEALAQQIAHFHLAHEPVQTQPDIERMQTDFADLSSIKSAIANLLSPAAAEQLEEWIFAANHFLKSHHARILERHQLGYYRELHGDLHSENIFLLEEPVVFDCIAFNEDFRRDDVLNELAFFCMDMDFHSQAPLGNRFLLKYLEIFPCLETEEDQRLFLYYKLYRANVRLKVNALKWQQTEGATERALRAKVVKKYFWLMRSYAKIVFRSKPNFV
ncbi:MAG: phosphotransferase [Bacteroidota bacterium]